MSLTDGTGSTLSRWPFDTSLYSSYHFLARMHTIRTILLAAFIPFQGLAQEPVGAVVPPAQEAPGQLAKPERKKIGQQPRSHERRTSIVPTRTGDVQVLLNRLELHEQTLRQMLLTTDPSWSALSASHRRALQPLEHVWKSLDQPRRLKWLEIADRFPGLSPDEQVRIQARMTEWARLRPEERGRARLLFEQAKQVSPSDRGSKWEAYQAPTDDERRQLAPRAASSASATSAKRVAPGSPVDTNLTAYLPTFEPGFSRRDNPADRLTTEVLADLLAANRMILQRVQVIEVDVKMLQNQKRAAISRRAKP